MRINFTGHITDFSELSPGSACIIQMPDLGMVWGIKAVFREEHSESHKLLAISPPKEDRATEVKPYLLDVDREILERRVLDITPEVVFSPVLHPASALQDLPLPNERPGTVVMVRDQVLLCVQAPRGDSYGNVAYLNLNSGELSYHIGGSRQSEDLLLEMGMYYLTRHWQLLGNERGLVLLESVKA